MKKFFAAALSAAMIAACLSGCGASSSSSAAAGSGSASETQAVSEAQAVSGTEAASAGGKTELVVFAAASMTETLQEIADMYKSVAPDVSITFNFDSSGTLVKQIEEGADCDLFISAGQKQMDEIDKKSDSTANPKGYDFVSEDTRIDILENKVTLCVPKNNPKEIKSFDDMAEKLKNGKILLAMGNSDVPVGQYTQKILSYYGLNEKDLASSGNITYGSNVKEVTTQISEGSVDCGVIYCTDAYSAGLTPVDYATAKMCGQVIYPAAVLKTSKKADAAKAFLDYLSTDKAMAVFEKVGFTSVK